ncbi:SRPBCC family protein [Nitrosopumilus sp. b2]|uniref:type II toxin-antitoxin system RatA family toxin n=1 Tax=Nitrosopumilus sp. b2 TaxID=2109908 RepID=UPI0015F3F1A7|nr:SRPBCC family protein [Nitrosopumilus sp. b2]KAF6245756.1 hypothetical protein C6989_01055 [Nitrosopumilus sp. b2]
MTSAELDDNLFELILPKKITDFEISRVVDVPNNRIFNVMADVENFPNILPKNILSVNILNKTENVIIAEEEFSEAGIKTKLVVKHTIDPYSKHTIEIIDGDAKGTIIIQSFEPIDSQTKLTTNVHLDLHGITSVVSFLPESNLVHALNTVISHFVEYSKFDIYERTVDSIYQQILNRPADNEGLLHYSTLLRAEQITEQDLREILLNSEEKSMKVKAIDELDNQTKITINDLYEKFLLRAADPEGLKHFGNLYENGATYEEIRNILLQSDEASTLSTQHPVRSEIMIAYNLLFDEFPNRTVVDHYHKMVDDGYPLIPNWVKNIFKWRQTAVISDAESSNAIRFLYNEGIIIIDEIPSNDKLLEYKNLKK